MVEAIEDFTNAILDARLLPDNANKRTTQSAVQKVMDARGDVTAALRALTAPTLRVVGGGPQPYIAGLRAADKPTCGKCKQQGPCEPSCASWAAAVREVVARAKGES